MSSQFASLSSATLGRRAKNADPAPRNGSTYESVAAGEIFAMSGVSHRLPPAHLRKGRAVDSLFAVDIRLVSIRPEFGLRARPPLEE